MSTLHDSEIADSADVKFHADMGRDEIMARLRQLPEVLDKTDAEIAECCGITPQMWSNYKSDGASDNVIRPKVALELWNAFGIPMEWVYGGQTTRADPAIKAKLALANRKAEAWLASRHKPRRSPAAHIAILAVTGALFFWGCGTAGKVYARTDGHGYRAAAVQSSKFVCRGEARTELDYIACMARYGYVRLSP